MSFAGLAARDGAAPNPQTPYELGSITKTFTGMLLADGIERGELRLDEPLAPLPDRAGGHTGGRRHVAAAGHAHGRVAALPGLDDARVVAGRAR